MGTHILTQLEGICNKYIYICFFTASVQLRLPGPTLVLGVLLPDKLLSLKSFVLKKRFQVELPPTSPAKLC